MARRDTGGATGITADDWFVTEDVDDTTLVLFAVAGDPRRPGRPRVRLVGLMLAVGLTGGIGSGKSAVADLLVARGAVLIDADLMAREVVAPGGPAYGALVERFGPGILAADGTLDRPALAAVVFADPEAAGRPQRHHPPGHRGGDARPAAGRRCPGRTASSSSPSPCSGRPTATLLPLDAVVVVDCPVEVAVDRLVEQRGMEPGRRRGPDRRPDRPARSGSSRRRLRRRQRLDLGAPGGRGRPVCGGGWRGAAKAALTGPGRAASPKRRSDSRDRYHRPMPDFEVVSPFRPAGDQPDGHRRPGRGGRPGRPLPDPAGHHRQRQDGHHRLDDRGGPAADARSSSRTSPWPPSCRRSCGSSFPTTGSSSSSPTTTTTSPRRTSRRPTPTSRRTRRSTTRSTGCATPPPRRCSCAAT